MIPPDFRFIIIKLCTFFSCILYTWKAPDERGTKNLLSLSTYTHAWQKSGKFSDMQQNKKKVSSAIKLIVNMWITNFMYMVFLPSYFPEFLPNMWLCKQ